MSKETSLEKCLEDYNAVKQTFSTGKTKNYEFRIRQLGQLKKMIHENELAFQEALTKDLGRSPFEAVGLDIIGLVREIDDTIKNLRKWMEPIYAETPAVMAPAISQYIYEPYGVCLIIGSFNYPVSLTLGPMLGAMMSGNCVIVKPSELSANTEALLVRFIPQYLDNSCYRVVTGAIETTTHLLSINWNKIFFTGSTRVGKIVMQAAAKNLTSVSLELGGKSPTYIDESVTDLELAVTRIMWGKCANAGQTCIAPDYILCHEKHYDQFLVLSKKVLEKFYGKDPQQSPDLCRIVSEGHCARIKGLLESCSGKIHHGGQIDLKTKFVAPTILTDLSLEDRVMREEIFGPLLPVFKVRSSDEAIKIINAEGMDRPLALYIFAKNRPLIDHLISSVQSGGVLVNDCLFHFANTSIPFGGVGPSGLGSYHGRFSLECFSHRRSIMRRDDHRILDVPVRYPPYNAFGLNVFRTAMKLPALPHINLRKFFGLSVVVAVAVYIGLTR